MCLHDLVEDQEIARFEGAQTLLSEMPGSEESDNMEGFVVDLLLLADAQINNKTTAQDSQ